MNAIWSWFNSDAAAIGILLTILTALWTALRSLAKKQQELYLQKLGIYHMLLEKLVTPRKEGQGPMLDCQVGYVFELRQFPAYYEVTLRILKGLRTTWGKKNEEDLYTRLLEEMDAAIAEIEMKSRTVQHLFIQWFRNLRTY